MTIAPARLQRFPCMLIATLTAFVALNAHAAGHANPRTLRASPSPYCQQTFSSIVSPDAQSDSRYVLLLTFDASAKDAVNSFFHTMPGDQESPAQDGCIKDPDQTQETPKAGKPVGIIVQGSCPTDCVTPPHKKKVAADRKNPLGDAKWGIFSADDGSDTPMLVWQILASEATHAGRILAAVKQDPNFPKQAYRGHFMIGYHDPRPPAKSNTP